LYSVGSGVIITGSDGSGVAVCPLDHPLVSLGKPGMWKFSRDFIPQAPTIYLNLYNNMWNTNFRYWYPGSWSSRVRLWTFNENNDIESRFLTASLEARTPLLVSMAIGKGGSIPAEQEGIACSRKGVVINAFSINSNSGKETLIRVWEKAGNSGKLSITLPPDLMISTAQPVNLRGEKMGDHIPVKRGKLSFELGKYAPASFILK
jgi:hypothetical protein